MGLPLRPRMKFLLQLWSQASSSIIKFQGVTTASILFFAPKTNGSHFVLYKIWYIKMAIKDIINCILVWHVCYFDDPGVNTPDHSTMFGNLVSMLRERVTPLVTILKAKDCPTVKAILTRTLAQLLDNTNLVATCHPLSWWKLTYRQPLCWTIGKEWRELT